MAASVPTNLNYVSEVNLKAYNPEEPSAAYGELERDGSTESITIDPKSNKNKNQWRQEIQVGN